MKKLKRVFSLILVLMLAVSFSACGKKKISEEDAETFVDDTMDKLSEMLDENMGEVDIDEAAKKTVTDEDMDKVMNSLAEIGGENDSPFTENAQKQVKRSVEKYLEDFEEFEKEFPTNDSDEEIDEENAESEEFAGTFLESMKLEHKIKSTEIKDDKAFVEVELTNANLDMSNLLDVIEELSEIRTEEDLDEYLSNAVALGLITEEEKENPNWDELGMKLAGIAAGDVSVTVKFTVIKVDDKLMIDEIEDPDDFVAIMMANMLGTL